MFRFVDTGVIHYNNGVAAGEGVHVIEEAVNELIEKISCVGPILDVKVEDAVERQCRQNGVSEVKIRWLRRTQGP